MKQLIKEILYAAHECGVCCDWSDKAAEDVLDILKRDGIVNQENEILPISEGELDRLAVGFTPIELIPHHDVKDGKSLIKLLRECFKAGYRKAKGRVI